MRNEKIRKCPVLNEQAEVNTGICPNKSLTFQGRKKKNSLNLKSRRTVNSFLPGNQIEECFGLPKTVDGCLQKSKERAGDLGLQPQGVPTAWRLSEPC